MAASVGEPGVGPRLSRGTPGRVDRGLCIAAGKARQRVESVLTAMRKTDPPYVVVTVMLVCTVALVAGYVLKSCPVSSSPAPTSPPPS